MCNMALWLTIRLYSKQTIAVVADLKAGFHLQRSRSRNQKRRVFLI